MTVRPPHHGLNQCRAREVAAAVRLQEDMAVLRPSGAHFHLLLYRLLQTVHTVVTSGRFGPSNPERERTEVAVSDEDLRQTKREGVVLRFCLGGALL